MKKMIYVLLVIIFFSIIFTFVLFEQLSWYHFGDIPTNVVLYRLIIFFIVLTISALTCYLLVIKNINKKNNKR